MKLEDYSTPLTDSCQGSDGSVPCCEELCECSRDLERKLAMCRKELAFASDALRKFGSTSTAENCMKVLEQTEGGPE